MTQTKQEIQQWFSETVTMCVEQGYRVTPYYETGAAQKYADGQSYPNPNSPEWKDAVGIGVVLDDAVLLDYDGNKADENGDSDGIIDLATLAATLGLEALNPVQESESGRSLHFLFSRKHFKWQNSFNKSKDGWLPYIDIKTHNQLMHLKPHKIINDFELPKKRDLPRLPDPMKRALTEREFSENHQMEPSDTRVDNARSDLDNGINLHGSALIIVNSMVYAGSTKEEIQAYFEECRDAVESRGRQRAHAFYNSELAGLIDSSIKKYGDRAPNNHFDDLTQDDGDFWSPYVIMDGNDKVRNIFTGFEMSRPAFNIKCKDENTTVTDAEGNARVLSGIDYLTTVLHRPTINSSQYDPTQLPVFSDKGISYVNSFMPNSVPDADPDWQNNSAHEIVANHFLTMFDDPAHGQKLIEWMAYNVQHMGKKILWSPIICGVQGDGKSTIFNILTAVLGSENTKDVSTRELFSDFSGYAEGACVCALEEMRVRGHNRHEVMNTLKPLITNERISVIRKGENAKNVKNTTNYIGFTNYADALVLDADDRRWAVFFSKYANRDELLADRNHAYFERLYTAFGNNAGAIRGWLLSINLDYFNPIMPPDTGNHKERMIAESRSDDQKHMVEIINSAERTMVTTAMLRVEAKLEDLRMTPTAIGRLLKSMGWEKYKRSRVHGDLVVMWFSPAFLFTVKVEQMTHDEIIKMAHKTILSNSW